MTWRDDVGTTGPDKSESKRYLLVPNCFLGLYLNHGELSISTKSVPFNDDNGTLYVQELIAALIVGNGYPNI